MTIMTHIFNFFRTYLVGERGVAQNTVASYGEAVKQLLVFASEKFDRQIHELDLASLRNDTVREFLDGIEEKNSISTRNQRLCAIRLFFSYLAKQHPEMAAAAESICEISQKKQPEKTMANLTQTELKSLFSVAQEQGNELRKARDAALLFFMYNTGARASEVVGVNVTDIVLEGASVVTLTGKGGKKRTLPLWPETVAAIAPYLNLRSQMANQEDALFLNNQKKRLTRFGLRDIIKRLVRRSPHAAAMLAKGVTAHTMRHTTAFNLLRATKNLVVVKDWLGHKDINTTSHYCAVDPETKLHAFSTFRAEGQAVPEPAWKNPDVIAFLHNLTQSAKHYVK
jgi:integrase/recombinase XerD